MKNITAIRGIPYRLVALENIRERRLSTEQPQGRSWLRIGGLFLAVHQARETITVLGEFVIYTNFEESIEQRCRG